MKSVLQKHIWHTVAVYRISPCAMLLPVAALLLLNAADARSGGAPPQEAPSAKSQKLQRPIPLGRDIALARDPASGELRATAKDSSPSPAEGAIRSRVTLVQVPCTVAAPDGTQVRGLGQNDFQLFEDGAVQEIASFDASATPASIVLVIDASPSIFHQLAEMRGALARGKSFSRGRNRRRVVFLRGAPAPAIFEKSRAAGPSYRVQVSRAGGEFLRVADL